MKSLSPSQPHAIIMVGIPGSGKTHFSEKFSETFHAPRVSQAVIAELGHISSADAVAVALYQFDELLKTHHSVIFDGDTYSRAQRAELAKRARHAGYEPLFIWIQIDQPTAESRTTGKGKPLTVDDFSRQIKRFTAPNSIEKPVVVSGKHTYASQAKVILKKLSAKRESVQPSVEPPARPLQPSPRRNITIR